MKNDYNEVVAWNESFIYKDSWNRLNRLELLLSSQVIPSLNCEASLIQNELRIITVIYGLSFSGIHVSVYWLIVYMTMYN